MMDIIGVQTWWTKSYRERHKSDGSDLITIPFVEMLTWITSAVLWRKIHGKIILFTDSRGKLFLKRNRLLRVWDRVDTGLDRHSFLRKSKRVARAFWAANKLFALREIKDLPCAVIDMDAICWKALPEGHDLIVAHDDSNGWGCYRNNRRDYGSFLPEEFDSDPLWNMPPFNTALMAFFDGKLKNLYTSTSIGFMEEFVKTRHFHGKRDDLSRIVFSEQKLLSLCSGLLGSSVMKVGKMEKLHLSRNPYLTHLWNSKTHYAYCFDSASRYCGALVEVLRKEAPEIGRFLDQIEDEIDKDSALNREHYQEQTEKLAEKLYRVRNVQGEVYVREPNLPQLVPVKDGSLCFVGEDIVCGKQGSFEIWRAGRRVKSYSIGNRPRIPS